MSKIGNILTKLLGPAAIISVLKSQNPEELAEESAQVIDELLDAQFGDKKSEQVQSTLVPFIERFIKKFNEILLKEGK